MGTFKLKTLSVLYINWLRSVDTLCMMTTLNELPHKMWNYLFSIHDVHYAAKPGTLYHPDLVKIQVLA